MTLVEMLVALSLVALLAIAGTQLLSTLLLHESVTGEPLALYPEAQRALQNMTEAVAYTTHLQLPNGRCRTTERLILSANLDNDGDGRIDEDPGDTFFGSEAGASSIDDDCDGLTDEAASNDDDEDGFSDEEFRNGIDDDGDGSIDEDLAADSNGDGAPGVRDVDDDLDGDIDEGLVDDDDEDGLVDEDGPDLRQFYYIRSERTLYEERPGTPPFVLLEAVAGFEATYLTGANGEPLVEIRLVVESPAAADTLTLSTRVYPENLVAAHGTTLP